MSDARERILNAAYDLFSQYGVRAVGIDAIIQRSGVARMTLYRHFASKDDLVLAFLELRHERWTKQWLMREVQSRATDPVQRLRTIFELLKEWFQRPDFEGCTFIRVLLETPEPEHRLHMACTEYLSKIRGFAARLAAEAEFAEPDELAHRLQILMKGAIIAASEGDRRAGQRAQEMGDVLLQSWPHGVQSDGRPLVRRGNRR